MTKYFKLFSVTLLTSACFISTAAAQDVPPMAAAILKSIEIQLGAKPTFDPVTVTDDATFSINNLKIAIAEQAGLPAVNVSIAEIAFANVGAEENGIISAGSINYKNIKAEINISGVVAYAFDVPAIAAQGVHVMVPVDNPTAIQVMRGGTNIAELVTSDAFTIKIAEQSIAVTGYKTSWEGDKVTGAGTFAGSITDVSIPETALAAMDPGGSLKAIGYTGINLGISAQGVMKVDDSALGIDFQTALTAKDMGTLNFTGAVDNVSLDLIAEMQKSDAEKREIDTAKVTPMFMSMLIGNSSISFQDGSLTSKVLPLAAAAMGMDAATFVATAPAQVQAGTLLFGAPEFSKQASEAVGAYLKDPKNLTITLAPATPVKVEAISAAATTNPASIIGLLGLSISANN